MGAITLRQCVYGNGPERARIEVGWLGARRLHAGGGDLPVASPLLRVQVALALAGNLVLLVEPCALRVVCAAFTAAPPMRGRPDARPGWRAVVLAGRGECTRRILTASRTDVRACAAPECMRALGPRSARRS